MTDTPNPAVQNLYVKIAAAVASMGDVHKTKTADTGKYKYSYASLSDTIDAVNEALEAQKLAMMQPIIHEGDYMAVLTVIIDRDTGDSASFPGPPFKIMADPQAVGSAVSYGRRYALTSLFALKVEDDDGGMAHRAVSRPGERTPAEKEVRAIVAKLDKDAAAAFQTDFMDEFSSTLTNLPESRHGDALTWAKLWVEGRG